MGRKSAVTLGAHRFTKGLMKQQSQRLIGMKVIKGKKVSYSVMQHPFSSGSAVVVFGRPRGFKGRVRGQVFPSLKSLVKPLARATGLHHTVVSKRLGLSSGAGSSGSIRVKAHTARGKKGKVYRVKSHTRKRKRR